MLRYSVEHKTSITRLYVIWLLCSFMAHGSYQRLPGGDTVCKNTDHLSRLPRHLLRQISSFMPSPSTEILHNAPVTSIAFDRHKNRLFTGAYDGTAHEYNLKTGKLKWIINTEQPINHLSMPNFGIHRLSIHSQQTADHRCQVDRLEIRRIGPNYSYKDLFLPDNPPPVHRAHSMNEVRGSDDYSRSLCITQNSDATYQVYLGNKKIGARSITYPAYDIENDHSRIAIITGHPKQFKLHLISTTNTIPIATHSVDPGNDTTYQTASVAWHPNKTHVLMALNYINQGKPTSHIALFDIQANSSNKKLFFKQPITALAYSPCGTHYCAILANHTGYVFDKTDQEVMKLSHKNNINQVLFHPKNPTILATASQDYTAKIWNTGNFLQAKFALSKTLMNETGAQMPHKKADRSSCCGIQ